MSRQYTKYPPKLSAYDQIKALDGVTEVEMFDFSERGVGFYVEGGSDLEISDALALHTYVWNRSWCIGDTEYKREFYTTKWYRNYGEFEKKFKELLGDAEVIFKPI